MLEKRQILTLEYYKWRPFTGSLKNMCFKVEKYNEKVGTKMETDKEGNETEVDVTEPRFRACVWPGPFAFDNTSDELKIWSELYPFEENSLFLIVDWMNEQYTKNNEFEG